MMITGPLGWIKFAVHACFPVIASNNCRYSPSLSDRDLNVHNQKKTGFQFQMNTAGPKDR